MKFIRLFLFAIKPFFIIFSTSSRTINKFILYIFYRSKCPTLFLKKSGGIS